MAIANAEEDPEPVLWSLARGVDGWGRIHTVERLKGTQNGEIPEWLVREGYRNQVMYEYLAYLAATTGRLLERLRSDPDDELVDSAGQIVSGLISGGPAEDIDDYEAAPDLLKVLLELLEVRAKSLAHFVVVDDIEQFLQSGDWEARFQRGWTQECRAGLLDTCRRITTQDRWPPLVEAALDSDDNAEFSDAQRAAEALGIDTFPAHWRRLEADH